MKYSQGEEDRIISEYFNGFKGRLLEIGAYHPEQLSNSRLLIESGWKAVLVEPSPKCYSAIEDFYKDNELVETVNLALGPDNGMLHFYDSAGGVATAFEQHYNVWKTTQLDYEEIEVPCITWKDFYKEHPGVYDFISLDTEGMDWSILQQMDLDETKTKVFCVETTYFFESVLSYLNGFGFNEHLYQDGNNIILGRRKYGI